MFIRPLIAVCTFFFYSLVFAESGLPPSKNETNFFMMEQSFSDLKGVNHHLSEWQDKILVVNFWASWCSPCVDELSDLNHLQTEHPSIQIVGISTENYDEAHRFLMLSDEEMRYPVLIGGKKAMDLAYKLGNKRQTIPYTVVIDHRGKIVKQIHGRINKIELTRFLNTQKNNYNY